MKVGDTVRFSYGGEVEGILIGGGAGLFEVRITKVFVSVSRYKVGETTFEWEDDMTITIHGATTSPARDYPLGWVPPKD